jgi:hypothetical protein
MYYSATTIPYAQRSTLRESCQAGVVDQDRDLYSVGRVEFGEQPGHVDT